MPAPAAEVQASLRELTKRAATPLRDELATAQSADAAVRALLELCPKLVDYYGTMAATLASDWYDVARLDAGLADDFEPVLAEPPPTSRVDALVRWGSGPLYGGAGVDAAGALLAGGMAKLIVNMHRDTIVESSRMDEAAAGWARHASANACAFCRMLATRGAVYWSKESAGGVTGQSMGGKDYRKMRTLTGGRDGPAVRQRIVGGRKTRSGTKRASGEKYHDACHCIAVPVFTGQRYEPPPYVKDWQDQYADAHESGDSAKETLAKWRANEGLAS